jgi:hypothetical protein
VKAGTLRHVLRQVMRDTRPPGDAGQGAGLDPHSVSHGGRRADGGSPVPAGPMARGGGEEIRTQAAITLGMGDFLGLLDLWDHGRKFGIYRGGAMAQGAQCQHGKGTVEGY